MASMDWPLPGDPNQYLGARHHYVPRFYLEGFANERGMITTVNRRTGQRHTSPTADTGAERDFNTAVNIDGELDAKSEQLLGYIEDKATRPIRNLLSVFAPFPPSARDRGELCLFLAFQLVRGRHTRRTVEQLGDLWARSQVPPHTDDQAARRFLQARDIEPTPEVVGQIMEFSAHLEELEFVPDPNEHLRVMSDLALEIFPLLLERPWRLIEFDGPALLTSDEPVVTHFRNAPQRLGRHGGLALADEIWFPLDLRRLLVLGPRGEFSKREGRLQMPVAEAETFNLSVAAGAYEYIYTHPDYDFLSGLDLPAPARCSHWTLRGCRRASRSAITGHQNGYGPNVDVAGDASTGS
jgi:hypothetical protein